MEAKWMFGHLGETIKFINYWRSLTFIPKHLTDINSDGYLSMQELYDLEHDQVNSNKFIHSITQIISIPPEWKVHQAVYWHVRLGPERHHQHSWVVPVLRENWPTMHCRPSAVERRSLRFLCPRLWCARFLQAYPVSPVGRCLLVRGQTWRRIC